METEPASRRHLDGENEPMLGSRRSSDSWADELGARNTQRARSDISGTRTYEKSPFSYRRSARSLKIVASLCCLSLIILVSFLFIGLSSEQSEETTPNDANITGEANEPFMGQQPADDLGGDLASTSPDVFAPPIPAPPPGVDAGLQDLTLAQQLDLQTNFVVSSESALREYVFNISRKIASPDGFDKSMILINDQSPGPLIEANVGDTIRVTVNNMMRDASTTLHWHGIDQRNTTWMDGVLGVSQCGIPEGKSFTYEFQVPDQRGTFWYHSHVSTQYTDGLYGPFIIHDPGEMIPEVDDDKILMIGDLYHEQSEELLNLYLSDDSPWSKHMPGMEPPPDNIIMNGQHVSNCTGGSKKNSMPHGHRHDILERHEEGADAEMTMHMGDEGDHADDDEALKCSSGSLWSTKVDSDDTVRLRLISHSTNVPYYFTIDNHTLEIVEMDGVEVAPIATTRVFMNPGQRYSVIVNANQTAGNYLMRATAASNCFHLPGAHHGDSKDGDFGLKHVGYEATGILSYDDTDIDATPIGVAWDVELKTSELVGDEPWADRCNDIPFHKPVPLREQSGFEVGPRNHHYFKYKMSSKEGLWRTAINKTVYTPLDNDATLWASLRQNSSLADLETGSSSWNFGPSQRVFVSPDTDQGAQIVINSKHMMAHPWHLHGQQFQVVGWGKGTFGKKKHKTKWNLENPMRRDTVTVPGNGHVVLRIAADNPGIWALHCHILWHAEGGMFVTVANQMGKLRSMLDTLATENEDEEGIKQKFCFADASRPSLSMEADVMRK